MSDAELHWRTGAVQADGLAAHVVIRTPNEPDETGDDEAYDVDPIDSDPIVADPIVADEGAAE